MAVAVAVVVVVVVVVAVVVAVVCAACVQVKAVANDKVKADVIPNDKAELEIVEAPKAVQARVLVVVSHHLKSADPPPHPHIEQHVTRTSDTSKATHSQKTQSPIQNSKIPHPTTTHTQPPNPAH